MQLTRSQAYSIAAVVSACAAATALLLPLSSADADLPLPEAPALDLPLIPIEQVKEDSMEARLAPQERREAIEVAFKVTPSNVVLLPTVESTGDGTGWAIVSRFSSPADSAGLMEELVRVERWKFATQLEPKDLGHVEWLLLDGQEWIPTAPFVRSPARTDSGFGPAERKSAALFELPVRPLEGARIRVAGSAAGLDLYLAPPYQEGRHGSKRAVQKELHGPDVSEQQPLAVDMPAGELGAPLSESAYFWLGSPGYAWRRLSRSEFRDGGLLELEPGFRSFVLLDGELPKGMEDREFGIEVEAITSHRLKSRMILPLEEALSEGIPAMPRGEYVVSLVVQDGLSYQRLAVSAPQRIEAEGVQFSLRSERPDLAGAGTLMGAILMDPEFAPSDTRHMNGNRIYRVENNICLQAYGLNASYDPASPESAAFKHTLAAGEYEVRVPILGFRERVHIVEGESFYLAIDGVSACDTFVHPVDSETGASLQQYQFEISCLPNRSFSADEASAGIRVPSGRHTIEIESEGYRTHREILQFAPGENADLTVEMIQEESLVLWFKQDGREVAIPLTEAEGFRLSRPDGSTIPHEVTRISSDGTGILSLRAQLLEKVGGYEFFLSWSYLSAFGEPVIRRITLPVEFDQHGRADIELELPSQNGPMGS